MRAEHLTQRGADLAQGHRGPHGVEDDIIKLLHRGRGNPFRAEDRNAAKKHVGEVLKQDKIADKYNLKIS